MNVQLAIHHLSHAPSGHAPLLMVDSTRVDNKPRPFRFLNLWTSHHGFLDVVHRHWQGDFLGSPMQVLAATLQHVKKAFKSCSQQVFGVIFEVVKQAKICS